MPDGYRVIIRALEEPECEIRVLFFARPDEQDCKQLADGITATTGLPVRLVIRRRLANGAVEETPWIPDSGKATTARTVAFMCIAALPYVGGLIMGYLLPGPATIGIVGLALWLGQMLSIFIYAKGSGAPTKYTKLSALTTIFTFGAAYGLAAVVGAFMLHAR